MIPTIVYSLSWIVILKLCWNDDLQIGNYCGGIYFDKNISYSENMHGFVVCLQSESIYWCNYDVLDFQCRHEFWHSNAWTALTDVPPKELRWPLCTGWTLGWCRMIPMPVSVQSYECCPVVVGWCLMLCHTQCNHSQTWNEQWHGTASGVCLCPLPISSELPLGWGWEPPCTVSSAHWCAS